MKNFYVLLMTLAIFGSCKKQEKEPSPSHGVAVRTQPEVKKSIYFFLEQHSDEAAVHEFQLRVICESDFDTIHEYREGYSSKDTFQLLDVCGKHVVTFTEKSDRLSTLELGTGKKMELEFGKELRKVFDWIEDKQLLFPDFNPSTPLWYSLYQDPLALEAKQLFIDEYMPEHQESCNKMKSFCEEYVFTLDSDFYHRIKTDINEYIVVNQGMAHRRAIWKLKEEFPEYDIRVYDINSEEVIGWVRGELLVQFFLFDQETYSTL